jgi:SAM-dependent methyltransferase
MRRYVSLDNRGSTLVSWSSGRLLNMTIQEFLAKGEELGGKAGVLGGIQDYFRSHGPRLHQSCERFGLFSERLGDVLEIGPFYGYTPFLLRPRSFSYTVLEGDDPVVRPLEPLYREHTIALHYVDFFEMFGPTRSATHKLPLSDAQFDTILCWETMEHFNFNPVGFVRELHRVLKPGGRVRITVPNKASFQNVAALLTGRGEKALIENYYHFENTMLGDKKAFYGFHWREYSAPELSRLFSDAGFQVQSCGTFNAFQGRRRIGAGRRMLRLLLRIAAPIFPRHRTHVCLVATR